MLRFADDEDNEELVDFVNKSHLCECSEGSPFAFKKIGATRITLEEMDKDLDNASLQWIILEVHNPIDMIIGAARYYTRVDDENERKGIIDLFAVATQNDTYCVNKTLSNQLLNRIEHMTVEQGVSTLEVHIPQWRHDLMEMLFDCGYTDQGGLMNPSSDSLLKPTMIIHMRKRISTEATNGISDLLSGMEVVEDERGTDHNERGTEIEMLMSTLFSALHKEHGDNKGFEDL